MLNAFRHSVMRQIVSRQFAWTITPSLQGILKTSSWITLRSVDGSIRTYDIRAGKLYEEKTNGKWFTASLISSSDMLDFSVKRSTVYCGKHYIKFCTLFWTCDRCSFERVETNDRVDCRYRGHRCEEYKVESILNNTDEYIISGSENGKVYLYDLVTVGCFVHLMMWRPKYIVSWNIMTNRLAAFSNTQTDRHYWLLLLMEWFLYGNKTLFDWNVFNFSNYPYGNVECSYSSSTCSKSETNLNKHTICCFQSS